MRCVGSPTIADDRHVPPEYAEVLGVPFSFAQTATARPASHRRASPASDPCATGAISKSASRVLDGYRVDFPAHGRMKPEFDEDQQVRAESGHDCDPHGQTEPVRRAEAIPFDLEGNAERLRMQVGHLRRRWATPCATYFKDNDGNVEVWRYPRAGEGSTETVVRATCLSTRGNSPKQYLKWQQFADTSRRQNLISPRLGGCGRQSTGHELLLPILDTHNPEGSTNARRLHHVEEADLRDEARAARSPMWSPDSEWEARFRRASSSGMDDLVLSYVKNHGLAFRDPLSSDGQERLSLPCPTSSLTLDDGRGRGEPAHTWSSRCKALNATIRTRPRPTPRRRCGCRRSTIWGGSDAGLWLEYHGSAGTIYDEASRQRTMPRRRAEA